MNNADRLRKLCEAGGSDKLPADIANIVYDEIPWRDINDAASEAHCDYLYDKGCKIVGSVLASSRATLALAARIIEAAGELAKENHGDDGDLMLRVARHNSRLDVLRGLLAEWASDTGMREDV